MCRSVAKKCKFLKYPANCLDTPSARVRIAILPIGCHNNICNVYNFHLMLVLMIWCSSPFWGFSFQPQSVSKINKYPLLQTTDFFFNFVTNIFLLLVFITEELINILTGHFVPTDISYPTWTIRSQSIQTFHTRAITKFRLCTKLVCFKIDVQSYL